MKRIKRYRQFKKALREGTGDGLHSVAVALRDDVQVLVGRQARYERKVSKRTGRSYIWVPKGEASEPGEPPKQITGRYKRSIEHSTRSETQQAGNREARVGSNAKLFGEVWMRVLELGGTMGGARIAPRPHMRPASRKNARKYRHAYRRAIINRLRRAKK